jgi:hypothetical protein
MIPRAYLDEWHDIAPWNTSAMVEQDLIISRAVVEIFSHPVLARHLVFRGGTVLHKSFFQPSARYSEDIDFVQTESGPIGQYSMRCAKSSPLGSVSRIGSKVKEWSILHIGCSRRMRPLCR